MIYFSIDIETNGLCAGIHSMISLGVAAINIETGEIVAERKWNLKPLYDMSVDPGTMDWWKQFPDAYQRATENQMNAADAILQFVLWVQSVCKEHSLTQPVAAAWKPGFDLAFVRYYLFRFYGADIFGRAGSGLDIKTLAAIALKQRFAETQISAVPMWLKGMAGAHNHDALDDAKEQALVMFYARKFLTASI